MPIKSRSNRNSKLELQPASKAGNYNAEREVTSGFSIVPNWLKLRPSLWLAEGYKPILLLTNAELQSSSTNEVRKREHVLI